MLISKKTVYTGSFVQLNVEKVELPNGTRCDLDVLHHPGGVAVVAFNSQQEICLLHQYRHAAEDWLWELPAGKIEEKEKFETTAKRELVEEAGIHASRWTYLGKTVSSPGVFTEVIQMYLAEDLTACEQSLEDEEVLDVHWFPLEVVFSMVRSGDIYDAKSVVGLFYLQQYLQAASETYVD